MRCVILLGALAALAAAFPRPQDQDNDPTPSAPAVSSPLQTWINPITSYVPPVPWPTPISESDDDSSSWFKSRSKRPHWEPIPIFTKECKCNLATARYPCWATDSLQVSRQHDVQYRRILCNVAMHLTQNTNNDTALQLRRKLLLWMLHGSSRRLSNTNQSRAYFTYYSNIHNPNKSLSAATSSNRPRAQVVIHVTLVPPQA